MKHSLHTVDLTRRPPMARIAGAAAAVVSRVRPSMARLGVAEIVESAVAESGHDDFGSPEYLEPLEVYVAALRNEAELTALGAMFARGNVTASLVNRLHLVATWTEHPEILDEQVRAPWVVVGLPRSGSTLLQNLFSADPRNRCLMGWEATAPTPPPERATFATDPRIAQGARRAKVLDVLAPLARELHPVGPDLPTECVTLMANSFASLEFASINWVPSYLDWCMEADFEPHYAFLIRQLQLLQWKCGADRWVLKSPAHLFWLDAIYAALPDATFIWTHRDPLDVVPSFCSFSAVLCGIGSKHVDPVRLGRRWAKQWADGLERGDDARRRMLENRGGDAPIVDIDYRDLVADPLAVVEQIYRQQGVELTAPVRCAMQDRLALMRATHHASHTYSLDQFGLTRSEEAERFGRFRPTERA